MSGGSEESMLRRVSSLNTLGEIDVLSVDECTEVADAVLDLREDWTVRSPSGLFFTLGVNAYMDLAQATDENASYFDPARRANLMLKTPFRRRARQARASPETGTWPAHAIRRRSGHARLPYLDGPRYSSPAGPPSTSTCSTSACWPGPNTRTRRAPCPSRCRSGCRRPGRHCRVWPSCTYPDDVHRLAAGRQTDPEIVHYHLGSAVVHSGHVLHQIGATPSESADDLRIMLQGHGLVVDNALILYW